MLGLGGVGLVLAAGPGQPRPSPGARIPTTTVMVSSRPLAASTTLTPEDVRSLRVPSSGVTAAFGHDLGSVVGRRLLVPVGAGTPLAPAVLGTPSDGHPADRLVPLSIPADHLALHAQMGEEVDIVAAEPARGAGAGGRVEVVGSGRLVSLSINQGQASGDPNGGGGVTLLLACDEPAAMRLLWAESFAHSLTVLARPDGAPPLPSVGGADA